MLNATCRDRRSVVTALLVAVWLCLPPISATGAEVVVFNDSTANGLPSTVFNTFLAGESIASWFTASCSGDIVGARIYWASQFGGGPGSTEASISFFGAGTFPTPGSLLQNQGGANAVVTAPTLLDGVMNEPRFLDPPVDSVPLRVPVTLGQTFAVSLKLFSTNSGNAFAPSVVADQDGCQGLTNAVDVMPGGWNDACPLGVTGDWVIRAVIDCSPLSVPGFGHWGVGAMISLLAATAWWIRWSRSEASDPAGA
jgi:hypothetical protein